MFAEHFTSPKNAHYEALCKALHQLQSDEDRDVNFFAHPQPEITQYEDSEVGDSQGDESGGWEDQQTDDVDKLLMDNPESVLAGP